MFSGKIGIWPLVDEYTAKRLSVNHNRGDVYVRNIEVVDKTVYKRYIIDKVIPAIKSNWPAAGRKQPIYIQQDNARPHVSPEDPDILAAGTADGWCIRLIYQPPNSPDLNVLDLGFFRAIQSIQLDCSIASTTDLIAAVTAAFDAMSSSKLNAIFLTLQGMMTCIMHTQGDNNFELPHMGKGKMRNDLPLVLKCDMDALRNALDIIMMQFSEYIAFL